jgi:hypothetical protein
LRACRKQRPCRHAAKRNYECSSRDAGRHVTLPRGHGPSNGWGRYHASIPGAPSMTARGLASVWRCPSHFRFTPHHRRSLWDQQVRKVPKPEVELSIQRPRPRSEKRRRDFETERFRCLEIDSKQEFRRLLDRKLGRFGPFQDSIAAAFAISKLPSISHWCRDRGSFAPNSLIHVGKKWHHTYTGHSQ